MLKYAGLLAVVMLVLSFPLAWMGIYLLLIKYCQRWLGREFSGTTKRLGLILYTWLWFGVLFVLFAPWLGQAALVFMAPFFLAVLITVGLMVLEMILSCKNIILAIERKDYKEVKRQILIFGMVAGLFLVYFISRFF